MKYWFWQWMVKKNKMILTIYKHRRFAANKPLFMALNQHTQVFYKITGDLIFSIKRHSRFMEKI